MTFVEELKELSKTVEFKHKLDRQFAELKAKMKASARSGYRYFKIEIFTIDTNARAVYLPDYRIENYYCFYTSDSAIYTGELINFLTALGFDTTEFPYVYNSEVSKGYSSLSMVVEW